MILEDGVQDGWEHIGSLSETLEIPLAAFRKQRKDC